MRTSCLSTPPPPQPQFPTLNHSSSRIPTSSCHHDQAHPIQSILDHHHLHTKKMKKTMATTNHDCPCQKKDHSQGSFPVTNGSETYKGWNPWLTITYQGWQVGKLLLPSSATTLLWIIQKSYSPKGTTAPTTQGHSTHNQIPTPDECLHKRRCTPSSQMKPFCQWLILPSTAKG